MSRAPRNLLSLIIWAVAAVGAGVLWVNLDPNKAPMPGIVEAQVHRVGPVAPARLASVFVRPGDAVQRGDAVAALDTYALDAELVQARSERAEVLAQLKAETAAYTDEVRVRRLELQSKLAEARAKLADAKVEQAGRKAELNALATRLERLNGALEGGLIEIDRLTALRAREERLSREARVGPETLRAWSKLDATVRQIVEAGDPALADRLSPFEARLETQSRRIEELLAQRARATLRAPASGRVSQVHHRPGDALSAGATVLELVADQATQVIAYAPEEAARALKPGTRVALQGRDHGVTASGIVDRLGPAVIQLPPRLWAAGNRPTYGRPVHVRLEGEHALLPGETMSLTGIGGAYAATANPVPSAMSVPPALRHKSRLEPSAALWLPDLKRFLIVSDDTGTGGDDEHQPWLFLADVEGRFDAEPVPIRGAPPVSDLESVAVGPDGAIYLLASQSVSRKGNRRAPRQQLLRVKRSGREFELSGATPLLTTLQMGVPEPDLRALGVGDDLDIEAMTWGEGGLLLGLKTPLEDGRAIIWLITGVDALFDGRGFAPDAARIKRYGTIALPTAGGDGGIADLLLEGDTFYVLSTLPDGPARGAAWTGSRPLRQVKPLAAWDFKGEALARHPDGLFVFFDAGDDTPRFTRLGETSPPP